MILCDGKIKDGTMALLDFSLPTYSGRHEYIIVSRYALHHCTDNRAVSKTCTVDGWLKSGTVQHDCTWYTMKHR